jgi:hypothetical protein
MESRRPWWACAGVPPVNIGRPKPQDRHLKAVELPSPVADRVERDHTGPLDLAVGQAIGAELGWNGPGHG